MKIEIGEKLKLPQGMAGSLMLLWAADWFATAVARMVDGPQVALLSMGEVPFGPLQYAEVILAQFISVAAGWAGVLILRRDARGGKLAIGALSALLLHRAAFGLAQGTVTMLQSGALGDMVCAGALIWFVLSDPRPITARVPRAADLALLIMIGREGLQVITPPVSLASLARIPEFFSEWPVQTALGAVSMLIGMAVIALALARLSGARTVRRALGMVIGVSLIYVFVTMGSQTVFLSQQIPGVTTRVSLYVVSIATLIERGILMSVLNDTEPEG
ncbi:MAG: hypothetical protein GF393_11765 [Armatimonadia bacterium]|nr:hypothetical protein [Armatimonadia bacterium]